MKHCGTPASTKYSCKNFPPRTTETFENMKIRSKTPVYKGWGGVSNYYLGHNKICASSEFCGLFILLLEYTILP